MNTMETNQENNQGNREKQKTKQTKRARRVHIHHIVGGLVVALSALVFFGVRFYSFRYSTGFQELLYTLSMPLDGAASTEVRITLEHTIGAALCAVSVYVCVLLLVFRTEGGQRLREHRGGRLILRILHVLTCVALLVVSFRYADQKLGIVDYFRFRYNPTTLYEDYYVDPDSVAVQAPEQKKNLIYLYLESMETTYATEDVGGIQTEVNYIPELTRLAQENISFGRKRGQIGGWYCVTGTSWTSGALLSTAAGIPFKLPVDPVQMRNFPQFLPGAITVGDILARDGYAQEFLCGSDGDYAGRATFYRQHGGYEIFDLFTAREKGYIPEDYFVWWGFEDKYLFQIARDEITRLAAGDQPFNFTFLTVDTHHLGGYVCDLCGDAYPTSLENVLLCQDRQVADFVAWCQEQPFWEDTVLIITGDHPRMDTFLVGELNRLQRPAYDCIINSAVVPVKEKGRKCTAMDMLPTTLRALGYTIPGDRLGLGTDLFSATPTLAEELTVHGLQSELRKYSDFYLRTFSKER